MIKHISHLYGANLNFTRMLVDDIASEQMVQQPHGVINHPAWSLGHLTCTADSLGQMLGLESVSPAGWDEKFKGGNPTDEVAAYPSKKDLLEALGEQHARNTEAVIHADPSLFSTPHPNEQTRAVFPTMGDLIIFLMTTHEGDHLGQIAAWRRAMGLGSFLPG
jgi:hypothetical protein